MSTHETRRPWSPSDLDEDTSEGDAARYPTFSPLPAMSLAPLLLALSPVQQPLAEAPAYDGQVVFKPTVGLGAEELEERLAAIGIEGSTRRALLPVPEGAVDRVGLDRIRVLELAPAARDAALARLATEPWIEWAEPNRGGPALTGGGPPLVPNDGFWDLQWQLDQANDIDMDLPEAWALQGGYEVAPLRIAVIDSGLHQGPSWPDLVGLPYTSATEVTNGVDDDGNGLVDDVNGYDFVRDDAFPDDENGHGSAVTGVLAGITDNGADIAGVAPGVEVVVVKVFNELGDFPVSGPWAGHLSVAAGLQYAADQGALLANNSWGVFTGFSAVVDDAVQYALDNGVHLVFAAGNFDEDFFFPSETDGLIAVAAIDSLGTKSFWSFGSASNYGPWVDLAAGGSAIVGYHATPGLFFLDGTSMAAPNASGVAAMVLSRFPALSQADLLTVLQESAVSIDGLNPAYAGLLGAGHVNALAALELLEPVADLGAALPGDTAPLLHAWGSTAAGGKLTASLSAAAPGAAGALVVGTAQVDLPIFGGTLVPSPDTLVFLTADADGAWSLDVTLASGLPAGATIYLQVGVGDAGAPAGFAFTNALSISS